MKKIEVLEKLDEVKKEFFDNISGFNLDDVTMEFFRLRFSFIEEELKNNDDRDYGYYTLTIICDVMQFLEFKFRREKGVDLNGFSICKPLVDLKFKCFC